MDIKIFKQNLEGYKISLGTLETNQKETYEIPGVTAVLFKNSSQSKSVRIIITFQGFSNLTIGYKEN